MLKQRTLIVAVSFLLAVAVATMSMETAITAGGGKEQSPTDSAKNALPPGAIARLGKPQISKNHLRMAWAVFLPDGRTVATMGPVDNLTFWEAKTGKELRSLQGYRGVLSPDGKTLAYRVKIDDKVLRFFDLGTEKEIGQVETDPDVYTSFWFSPDGRYLAIGSRQNPRPNDPPLRLVEVPSGKEVKRFGVRWPINRLAFSHDGKRLATAKSGGREPNVQLWDVATGKELQNFSNGGSTMSNLSFSPDGKYLAAVGNCVCVWDLDTGKQRWRIYFGDPTIGNLSLVGANGLAFSPNGKMLAVGASREGGLVQQFGTKASVYLIEAATGREFAQFDGGDAVDSVAFAPDGLMLVSCRWWGDYTPLVWDVTGQILAKPQPLTPRELESCWSDLGRREPFKEGWVDMRATDAAEAWKAICALASRPDQALPMLKKRLPANGKLDAKRLARLLDELDSEDFGTREKAGTELLEIGPPVKPFLQNALAGKLPVEARKRIEVLLGKPGELGGILTEEIRWSRALEILEFIGTPDARRLLESLAQAPVESELTKDATAAVDRLSKRPSVK